MNTELYMAVVLAEPHHYNPSSLSPDPNYIWIPSPSEHVPTHHTSYEIPGVNLPHLSPGSTYQRGRDILQIDMSNMSTPPHQSPHHGYDANDGCATLLSYQDFNTGPCEMLTYHTGERSPDSGSEFPVLRQSVIRSKVYSPQGHSPQSTDFEAALAMSDGTLTSLCDTSDYMANGIPHYSTANHPPPPLYPMVPTSCSLSYSDIPMFVRDQSLIDPNIDHTGAIPIIPSDGAPPPPIQYYPECGNGNDMPQFLEPHPSPPCVYPPNSFTEKFQRSHPPPARHPKRQRKVKAPATVDPSDIKDIPASAQLWEFLLKVLKKPKYSYMVSWENQQDGLFRFHDPPAFAALWGRHRNRPSMTYDKVARALRYYYRRDILEQVGGRLTYKFSPRLCKQFTTKASSPENTNSQSED